MPLKHQQTHRGHNPWDEINCPLCEENNFTSIDHASVWCDKCNAEFYVRDTSGDPGYVVDCMTDRVWTHDTVKPEVIGEKPYCIVKNGEPPRWLIITRKFGEGHDGLYDLERYVHKVRMMPKTQGAE